MPKKVSRKEIEIANKIASKSKLTKKDIEEFSRRIKSSATKRFLQS
ncbi:MAG: hypothetical protein Q7S21_04225 [archaeon]|nr:hypothetical protein [archaeon]